MSPTSTERLQDAPPLQASVVEVVHDVVDRAERSSVKPPSPLIPGKEPLTHCMSSPRRHGVHSPETTGCTVTVSPTSTLETPEPISWTQPALAWPGVSGSPTSDLSAHCASWMCRSERHSPAAPIFTTTSNGRIGWGSSTEPELERLVVPVKPCRVHAAASSGSLKAYGTRSSERQTPPLASRLVRTSLAIRSAVRQVGGRDRRAVGQHERRRAGVDRYAEVAAQLEAAAGAWIVWERSATRRAVTLLGRRG